MAGAAEAVQLVDTHFGTGEVYGQSLRIIGGLGRVSCGEVIDRAEAEGIEAEAYADYYTGVQENLTTDPEYGDQLKFEPVREYDVVDDKVYDKAGTRMLDLIREGRTISAREAEADPRLLSEVERCEGDILTAEIVEALEEGELYAAISMDPKEAFAKDGTRFWKSVGYREGMAVIQVYYRKDGKTVLGGAYSVKNSNKETFQKLWASYGVNIDASLPANQWIRHGLRTRMDEEQALMFGPMLHTQYREMNGQSTNVISVTEFMKQQEPLIRGYFEVYIRGIAKALHTGRNNEVMQGFATALMNTDVRVFDAAARTAMMRIANAASFTEADARFMENAVRYSLVEELRKFLSPDGAEQAGIASLFASGAAVTPDLAAYMHTSAAANVSAGVTAGRSYGGCSPAKFGEDEAAAADDDDEKGQQDVFGGKSHAVAVEACDYKHTGCYCCKYDDFGNELLEPKTVVANRDERGVARCKRIGCGAILRTKYNSKGEPIGSIVISRGNIWQRAQARAGVATA